MVTRFLTDERGTALVEFSLVVMMMVVVAFGTINWARFFLLRGQLADAVRDAARYGATLGETAADTTAIGSYARTLMANATTASTAGTITVSFVGTAGTDRRVRVALTSFPYTRLTTWAMGTGKTISTAAEFRREQP